MNREKQFGRMLNVRDINFGSIDARQEVLSRDPQQRRLFFESFYTPPSFKEEMLISGDKFIVCGPKGSGKTAFLSYLRLKIADSTKISSRFIVFRDDITEQDRDKIANISGVSVYIDSEGDETGGDAINAWQIFIHREIVQLLEENPSTYADTSDIQQYKAVVKKYFSTIGTNKFRELLGRIQKSRVKIWGVFAEAEAEFNFVNESGDVDTSEFVRYLNHSISKIHFTDELTLKDRLCIYFDEVNISFVRNKQYARDAILIRDLIAACGKMNRMFSEKMLPIFIYCAIRSEVVDAIESSSRELRKWIEDGAVNIDWYKRGAIRRQPIVSLIKKRIIANERAAGIQYKYEGDHDIWKKYFQSKLFQTTSEMFIVQNTWGRPRDIVRLLSMTAKNVRTGERFSTEAISSVAHLYSASCWEEKKDELNTKYTQSEIECIKKILTGFQRVFSFNQIEANWNYKKANDARINRFCSGRNMIIVLEDLFRVGIIGNVHVAKDQITYYNFLYTGFSNFSPENRMCVHRSLWIELNLTEGRGQIAESFREQKRRPRPNTVRRTRKRN